MSKRSRRAWLVCIWLIAAGCSRATPSPEAAAAFDQERAWEFLVTQVAFGPRNPGSEGHTACRDYLLGRLQEFCDEAYAQPFTCEVGGQTLALDNLIGVIRAETGAHILLCAHWDTRPRAEQDPVPSNRPRPIPGANDGASGVAVLLEIARVLRDTRPPCTVTFALFDGEDYGVALEDYLLGSKYYASQLGEERPDRGVLLDMVGDADLQIYQEGYSLQYAPWLVKAVWTTAGRLGETAFRGEPGYTIVDDHVPLCQAGVPTIDIIDFDYPYWHTLEDTTDKCSAASLGAVGRVVLEALLGGAL